MSKYCVRMVALMSIQVNTVNCILSECKENMECVPIIDPCIFYATNVNEIQTKGKQRITYCSWLSSFCSFNRHFCVFTLYSNRTVFTSTVRYCLLRYFFYFTSNYLSEGSEDEILEPLLGLNQLNATLLQLRQRVAELIT